jgi:hypothetical protein
VQQTIDEQLCLTATLPNDAAQPLQVSTNGVERLSLRCNSLVIFTIKVAADPDLFQ